MIIIKQDFGEKMNKKKMESALKDNVPEEVFVKLKAKGKLGMMM